MIVIDGNKVNSYKASEEVLMRICDSLGLSYSKFIDEVEKCDSFGSVWRYREVLVPNSDCYSYRDYTVYKDLGEYYYYISLVK